MGRNRRALRATGPTPYAYIDSTTMTRARRTFTIETSMTAKCSVDDVMSRLLDASKWPAWQPEIIATEGPARVGRGDVVRGRARMLGFDVDGRSDALEVGEGVFEEDVIVGVSMRVRYEVRPESDGCLVIHQLESRLPAGVSGRLLAFLLRARLRKMQRTAIERLVTQSESASAS